MERSLRNSFSIFVLAGTFAAGSSSALAGTTGAITGVVSNTSGAPIADARVVAVSPSETLAVTTDASGRFSMLSLAPDTYTITGTKTGFETSSITGISVFADQVQTIRVTLAPALKTIARVTARSSMDVVKPGTTTDVYSVNSAVTQAAAGIGGGGNLNNAYSAIASMPGAFVPPNQQGWDQVVYIRGGNYDQIGYEFDGVPVNRSFDNYPGGTAGTLGQQELQLYAGGGTAGQTTSGLAGFINQVIKTGTYPGYGTVSGGVGSPTYYHNLQLEVGGATPNRLFSYYLGVGGYNQDYRYLDQFNGSNLGDVWGYPAIAFNTINLPFGGVFPTCGNVAPSGTGFYSGPNSSPVYDPYTLKPGQRGYLPLPAGVANDPGCYQTLSPAYASYSDIADRETVINLHFGIPHRHDAGRDDVQVLYNTTSLHSSFYSSLNDLGPHVITQLSDVVYGEPVPEVWGDFVTWPSGTHFGQSPSGVAPVPYFDPGSPTGRCANINPYNFPHEPPIQGQCAAGTFSTVPADARDAFWNNASIAKLQFQHNMGSNAYFRIYGYSFYSDWLQTSPLSYGTPFFGFGVTSYDYELESHTRGLAFTFADQLSSQHLLTVDANYTTASTNRYNNTNFNNTVDTIATSLTNGKQCFSYKTHAVVPCNDPSSSGTFTDPEPGPAFGDATWQITYTGNSGFVNNVTPNFTSFALEDLWTPTDRLNVDLGLRDEIYAYNLANTSNNGQKFLVSRGPARVLL